MRRRPAGKSRIKFAACRRDGGGPRNFPQESGGGFPRSWQTDFMNDYERIARVIRYLDEHHAEQPDLAALAKRAGLSPFHFHRLFSAWAGVTPKDFLQ
jgi:AraC-like DNA-binding protein